jgi:hypothetical protein
MPESFEFPSFVSISQMQKKTIFTTLMKWLQIVYIIVWFIGTIGRFMTSLNWSDFFTSFTNYSFRYFLKLLLLLLLLYFEGERFIS